MSILTNIHYNTKYFLKLFNMYIGLVEILKCTVSIKLFNPLPDQRGKFLPQLQYIDCNTLSNASIELKFYVFLVYIVYAILNISYIPLLHIYRIKSERKNISTGVRKKG